MPKFVSRPSRPSSSYERAPKHARVTRTWGTVAAVSLCAGVVATTILATVTQGLDLADLLPGGDDATVQAAGNDGPDGLVTTTMSPAPPITTEPQTPAPVPTTEEPALIATPSAAPSRTSRPALASEIPAPPPAPPAPLPSAASCSADVEVIDWRRGVLVTVTVANTGAAEVADWTVTLTLSQDAEIRGRDQWRSLVEQDGRQVSVTADNPDDDTLGIGETAQFAFTASRDGDSVDEMSADGVELNEVGCG